MAMPIAQQPVPKPAIAAAGLACQTIVSLPICSESFNMRVFDTGSEHSDTLAICKSFSCQNTAVHLIHAV